MVSPKPGIVAMLLAISCEMALAGTYALEIGQTPVQFSDGTRQALTINGTLPAPTLRFREGEELIIRVSNTLDELSSIHWHGLILPYTQDGVPGFSYTGIQPGETFTYRFPARQAGTYWYHSHSAMQEQRGLYGAIIIEPKAPDPFHYDREYAVVLSDWHDTWPKRIFAKLKRQSDYYNFHQQTLFDLLHRRTGESLGNAIKERLAWGKMRMMKTDIADVSGYAYLINGMDPKQNWTALFQPGERIRLRLVNASAMSLMDIYIPGLSMTVVQADGNNIHPVTVDELRIAVAETYDVLIEPENRAYTLMAEPIGRTGYARATLTPHRDMSAQVPPVRPRPQLTMADMPMSPGHAGHAMQHGVDHAAMGHDTASNDVRPTDTFYRVGSGLVPVAYNGGKFLSYSDLKALRPIYPERPVDRELTLRLTGNMERYIWSINGQTFADAEPLRFRQGERVRFRFINDTMMIHPMHLHGMWMILDNGHGRYRPAKHVILVAPAMTVTAEVEIDAAGHWPFHCHLLYHMHGGMMRRVIVEPADPQGQENLATLR